MGIYYRYAAAALILLFCADTYAVTRKTVNHGQSKESVIKGSGSSFQTPNGEAAYYGRDFVDEHTAGNRFTTNDSPGASGKQKVTIKPTLRVDPKKAAKELVGGLRRGVPGVVASAAAAAVIAAIEGVIEDGVVKVPSVSPAPPQSPSNYRWRHIRSTQTFDFPDRACASFASFYSGQYPNNSYKISYLSPTAFKCTVFTSSGAAFAGDSITRVGDSCPGSTTYNPQRGQCETTALISPNDSHWTAAEQYAAAQNSDFTRDIIRTTCEASIAPGRCYDEMSQWGDLHGPSSQTDTPQTTTTIIPIAYSY